MIQKAEPLTEEDDFLLKWGEESKKHNLVIANDVLGKIAALSATITGGGVIFLNKSVISEYLITPILILFLISLTLSFLGVLPYQEEVDLASPTEIELHKSQALNHKLKCIRFSAACFFFGLLMAVAGVSYKAFHL